MAHRSKFYSTKQQCILACGFSENNTNAKNSDYVIKELKVYRDENCPLPNDEDLNFIKPDFALFDLMPLPGSSDWLACHKETGQTFRAFAGSLRNRISKQRDTIFILPLSFKEGLVPKEVLDGLVAFGSVFFGMKVAVMKSERLKVKTRINEYTDTLQANAGEILTALENLLPSNAFAVGAVTACDLYPREEWNFVFGLASLQRRVGVYSLARYLPSFPKPFEADTAPTPYSASWALLLKRTCRVMLHELAHMFGLKHCIHFRCLMNGSNHFEESEGRPLGLCPICLRKLHLACRFPSLRQRFEQLRDLSAALGLQEEAAWFSKRLNNCRTA